MHSILYLLLTVTSLLLCSPTYAAPDVSQFQVHSWAGRLHLFQADDPAYDDNLIIWFNGGPGCSSLIGLTTGNGPISFDTNSSHIVANPYSWSKFGHVLYIDQPVGTGYSTASQPYPAVDNDAVTSHFYDWLQLFFAHFPHLRSKQMHLMGESWAGIYIPYFASAIVDNQDTFPVNLRSLTIGDGSIGNGAAIASATIGRYLESQQSILQIPDDVLAVFKEASETCSFDDVLEQAAQFPPENKIYIPGNPEGLNSKHRRQQRTRRDLGDIYNGICNIHPVTPEEVQSTLHVSMYDISHDCNTINTFEVVASYFSRADAQTALNLLASASTSPLVANAASNNVPFPVPSPFSYCNDTILDTLLDGQSPQPPAHFLLPTLVTSHNISLHVYFGEYDMLLNHYGAELTLQNMTWNGAQGFSSPINRPFYQNNAAPRLPQPRGNSGNGSNSNEDDSSRTNSNPSETCPISEAGKWASERGVTYHRFRGAGHSVFLSKPREMFAYVRDVVVATGSTE
ncbi:Alpha/Beta hydrolase protein [Aspergillus aurantiobrunneus]